MIGEVGSRWDGDGESQFFNFTGLKREGEG